MIASTHPDGRPETLLLEQMHIMAERRHRARVESGGDVGQRATLVDKKAGVGVAAVVRHS
jgi:hypothetical protein